MIESLVADDPRRSADRLLARLCEVAGADGGAVLVPDGGNPRLFLSCRLPLNALASLPIRFQDHRGRLAKGDTINASGFSLFPLVREGGETLGWVYLETARSIDPKDVKPFLLGLAKALSASEATSERESNVNRADVNRANILRILEENDWNIARVSRELGVTRRTLYMRLAAFGIARKKVPRLAKPLTN